LMEDLLRRVSSLTAFTLNLRGLRVPRYRRAHPMCPIEAGASDRRNDMPVAQATARLQVVWPTSTS
jgi:hypothetical protein